MLDRLISGAGALTHRADRLVRGLARGGGTDVMDHRPGSILVIVLLLVAGAAFGFAAVEANDNPTPRVLAPAAIADTPDLGRRVYATVTGNLSHTYVETYEDENANGSQDEGEDGEAWFYFLVEPDGTTGVTVRSTRPPSEMLQYETTGVLVRDREYLSEDVRAFADIISTAGITMALDADLLVDTTQAGSGDPVRLDLGAPPPPDGAYVTIGGEAMGYLEVCQGDPAADGTCTGAPAAYDIFLGHRDAGRAITLYREELPSLGPIEFTGMLRREPGSIREAKTVEGLDFGSLGIDVSEVYLLDDQATPASAILAAAVAAGAAVLALVLAIGLAGGYVVFRHGKRLTPAAGFALEPGGSIPVRVTGKLRQPDGLVHVREASGRLVRFVLAAEAEQTSPLDVPAEIAAEGQEAPAPQASSGAATLDDAPDLAPTPEPRLAPGSAGEPPETALIVERLDHPEGVALGKGELREVASGRVMPLRGARPALRVVAGTGPLLLSFDSKEDRDRAAGELIRESGLVVRDTGIARA